MQSSTSMSRGARLQRCQHFLGQLLRGVGVDVGTQQRLWQARESVADILAGGFPDRRRSFWADLLRRAEVLPARLLDQALGSGVLSEDDLRRLLSESPLTADGKARVAAKLDLGLAGHSLELKLPAMDLSQDSYHGTQLVQINVPLLGSVPLTMPLREQSDAGEPLVLVDPDDPAAQAARKEIITALRQV